MNSYRKYLEELEETPLEDIEDPIEREYVMRMEREDYAIERYQERANIENYR